MPIAFQCKCGTSYSLPDQFAGKKTKCRKCGADLAIPLAPASDDLSALTAPAASSGTTAARRKTSGRSRAGLVAGLLFFGLLLTAVGGGAAYWYFMPSTSMGDGIRYLPT